jgi:hypothetical protein
LHQSNKSGNRRRRRVDDVGKHRTAVASAQGLGYAVVHGSRFVHTAFEKHGGILVDDAFNSAIMPMTSTSPITAATAAMAFYPKLSALNVRIGSSFI